MTTETRTTHEVIGSAPFGPDAVYASVQYPCTDSEHLALRARLDAAEQALRVLVVGPGHTLGCRCDDVNCVTRADALNAAAGAQG